MLSPLLPLMAHRLVQLVFERPKINSTIVGSQRYQYEAVNLGFTVQAGSTLYLTVVNDAANMNTEEFIQNMGEIQRRAQDLRLPIEFEMDQDERTAHVSIPGYLEGKGEPLKNPFNGASHRVQIRCPDGIEFDIADIGNASTDIKGGIPMKLENSYGQFIYLDHTNNGPAHNS